MTRCSACEGVGWVEGGQAVNFDLVECYECNLDGSVPTPAQRAAERERELVEALDEAVAEIEASYKRRRPAFIEFAEKGRALLAKCEQEK